MRRTRKYTLIAAIAAFMCLLAALWEYSSNQDQQNVDSAKNQCEVGCIGDSGGLKQCREICAHHPEHYP